MFFWVDIAPNAEVAWLDSCPNPPVGCPNVLELPNPTCEGCPNPDGFPKGLPAVGPEAAGCPNTPVGCPNALELPNPTCEGCPNPDGCPKGLGDVGPETDGCPNTPADCPKTLVFPISGWKGWTKECAGLNGFREPSDLLLLDDGHGPLNLELSVPVEASPNETGDAVFFDFS